MGVHDLWSIVEPVRESVPLYSLSGKTLAVDLSLWVCEAQHVQAMMGRVKKPHLRNLFFRVSSLTLMGIKLVFVMEGEAPKLKSETMSKRTEMRHGGFRKASTKKATSTSRGRFNAVLRECAEMLDYLGVPWVTAAGEAEAMCAYLDSGGLVDGCITNDGDAFLYGARTIYRNFNMNSKDPQVDCYRTSSVQSELRLSRDNLVGLAILLGCDYIPKGIPGVGKEQTLKLIQTLKGQSLLQRFKQWQQGHTEVSDVLVKNVPHCNICRHPGSTKAHERKGCVLCNSQHFCQPQDFDYQCPCDWHGYEQSRQASSLEANVRRKTMANEHFPFTEIICEFLVCKDKPVAHFKRRQPNMLLMQKFAYEKMEWPKHYTSEKVLVLMTYTELMNKKYRRAVPSQIKPVRILKARVRNAVACFEVIWNTPENYVFPEEYPAEGQHEVRTVEEESLFSVAFPEIVESHLRSKALAEENKAKKKKPRSKKEKLSAALPDDVSDLLAKMNLQKSSERLFVEAQTLLAYTPNTDGTELQCLEAPVSQMQPQREKKDPSGTQSEAAATSPSISAAIDALHLSDVDWDASSFTSSPATHTAETTTNPKQADGKLDLDPFNEECSLRDRVLMRNTAKTRNWMEEHKNWVPKHLGYEVDSSESHSFSQSTDYSETAKRPCPKEPLVIKESQLPALLTNIQSTEKCSVSKKLPQKSTFVRTALSSSQKSHSDSGHSNRKGTGGPQAAKKSVCVSLCSSSEDSDTENQPSGAVRQIKAKPVRHKPRDLPLKQSSHEREASNSQGPRGNTHQDAQRAEVHEDASPASPATVLDGSDRVACGDSPLPLAERLRLKFLH